MSNVINDQQRQVAIDLRNSMNSLAGGLSAVLSEAVSLMKHNLQQNSLMKRYGN